MYPVIRLKTVVFPPPLRLMIPRISPDDNSSAYRSTASNPRKDWVSIDLQQESLALHGRKLPHIEYCIALREWSYSQEGLLRDTLTLQGFKICMLSHFNRAVKTAQRTTRSTTDNNRSAARSPAMMEVRSSTCHTFISKPFLDWQIRHSRCPWTVNCALRAARCAVLDTNWRPHWPERRYRPDTSAHHARALRYECAPHPPPDRQR